MARNRSAQFPTGVTDFGRWIAESSPPPRKLWLLRQLYARTPMQSTFSVALTVLVTDPASGELVTRTVPLKELLERYIAHRDEAIARRANGLPRHVRMQMLKEELGRLAAMHGDKGRTELTRPLT